MHFNQQSAVDFYEPFRVRNEYFELKFLRCMQNIVGIGVRKESDYFTIST